MQAFAALYEQQDRGADCWRKSSAISQLHTRHVSLINLSVEAFCCLNFSIGLVTFVQVSRGERTLL
jgi:hypothetical protein